MLLIITSVATGSVWRHFDPVCFLYFKSTVPNSVLETIAPASDYIAHAWRFRSAYSCRVYLLVQAQTNVILLFALFCKSFWLFVYKARFTNRVGGQTGATMWRFLEKAYKGLRTEWHIYTTIFVYCCLEKRLVG